MRKFIFLDFDGVTNSLETLSTDKNHRTAEGFIDGYRYRVCTPEHTQWLNVMMEEVPDVEWVLSSSHRRMRPLEANQRQLLGGGFNGQLIGQTPQLERRSPGGSIYISPPRGAEIDEWLETHLGPGERCRFAILDDNSDMEPHMEHLVRTSIHQGLRQRDVQRVVRMLTQGPVFTRAAFTTPHEV